MATLKTNYKDDMFSGDRKYREIRNSDGTVSFEDVTVYSQEGDVFASADINATNTEVNTINASLTEKVSQYSDTTYSEAVKGLGYDPVSKKLCLIVEEGGADTPVPFSGTEAIISVQLIGRQGVFRAYNAQNKALLVGNGTTTINDTSVQLNILTSGGYTSGFKVTTTLPFQYAVLDSAGTFDNWVTGTSGGTIPAYQDTSILLKF